jgi:hypothetical protein
LNPQYTVRPHGQAQNVKARCIATFAYVARDCKQQEFTTMILSAFLAEKIAAIRYHKEDGSLVGP